MDLNLSGSHTFNKYIFNSRKQEDNESFQDFANTLVNLGNAIGADENQIVDRFIAGLKNDSSRIGILQVPSKSYSKLSGFFHLKVTFLGSQWST